MLSVKHTENTMPVLKREIAKQTKGSFAETEDWWSLCYDSEAQAFFVEHCWHHMNAHNIDQNAHAGTKVIQIEGYSGPGADKIEDAKASLLAEAGHA
ncbi:hypothetical protein C5F44_15220 [Fuscovulum blasticum DSM 2131]|uniref:Uncharacterized protein n=2 Tax=Fuscovulum blasticum TaxID=1075 RepID=A0A2T4J5A7_FUSBL|nr:hypothetical protein C5F44_15220 [Fuscovulum blasticum DSM 2131]